MKGIGGNRYMPFNDAQFIYKTSTAITDSELFREAIFSNLLSHEKQRGRRLVERV